MSATKKSAIIHLSADKVLGIAGSGLAAASLGFGVYMNIHGPAASFGHSKDFTVFAQLTSPRAAVQVRAATAGPAAGEPLDMTATASIQAPERPAPSKTDGRRDADILSSITLEAATLEAATILVDGRAQTVHVGDNVPNVGEVLEIRPGAIPAVRTTRGLILSARPTAD